VARRVVTQVQDDNISILAAAVALYLFLALIPGLAASLSLYGLVSTGDEVTRTIRDLTVGLPPAARELVRAQALELASREVSGLSAGLVASVAAALFSASKGTQALVKALNIAYNEWETRGFLRLRLLSVGLTVGIVVVVVAGVSVIVKVGNVAEGLPGGGPVITVLRWPLLGLLLVGVLSALYRVSPDRDDPKWRWTTPGAVLAAVLVALASLGLSVYTSRFGESGESSVLGAVVVLVLWLFASAYGILLGAELDSELEHQTARDSTVGPEQPLGERGAVVADHVAP
jgi:membrane protein